MDTVNVTMAGATNNNNNTKETDMETNPANETTNVKQKSTRKRRTLQQISMENETFNQLINEKKSRAEIQAAMNISQDRYDKLYGTVARLRDNPDDVSTAVEISQTVGVIISPTTLAGGPYSAFSSAIKDSMKAYIYPLGNGILVLPATDDAMPFYNQLKNSVN